MVWRSATCVGTAARIDYPDAWRFSVFGRELQRTPAMMRRNSMRAFYSTQKYFRAFILGTPEGWQVSLYDLRKHEWVEKGGRIEDNLKTAKATAQEQTSLLLGKKAPEKFN